MLTIFVIQIECKVITKKTNSSFFPISVNRLPSGQLLHVGPLDTRCTLAALTLLSVLQCTACEGPSDRLCLSGVPGGDQA